MDELEMLCQIQCHFTMQLVKGEENGSRLVKTSQIYPEVVRFVVLQLVALGIVAYFLDLPT